MSISPAEHVPHHPSRHPDPARRHPPGRPDQECGRRSESQGKTGKRGKAGQARPGRARPGQVGQEPSSRTAAEILTRRFVPRRAACYAATPCGVGSCPVGSCPVTPRHAASCQPQLVCALVTWFCCMASYRFMSRGIVRCRSFHGEVKCVRALVMQAYCFVTHR